MPLNRSFYPGIGRSYTVPIYHLYLFINSPGRWVIPGVAIYDTMQFVQPDVHTICMGLVASMGSFLLAGGVITKRLAFPHARRQ
uniref:ATP-dependent Clp protease proteolytic subunit n=1 Tax=Gossypium raimondii TaxID=29730 RepID=A0A0D2U9N8_GOSRA|nr:hypothetical protein B456_010G100700 [Gossypium raimondii]